MELLAVHSARPNHGRCVGITRVYIMAGEGARRWEEGVGAICTQHSGMTMRGDWY